jgi:hypothetical protein
MSSKSLSELLEILSTSEDGVEHLPEDINQFISDMEIEASDTEKIPAFVIYWEYVSWKKAGYGRMPTLTKITFFKQLSKIFETGRHDYRYYKVKANGFYYDVNRRFKIKRMIKEEHGKKKKKGRNKVSRSK